MEVVKITYPRLHAPKALLNNDEGKPLSGISQIKCMGTERKKWHRVSIHFNSTESVDIQELSFCVGRNCENMQ